MECNKYYCKCGLAFETCEIEGIVCPECHDKLKTINSIQIFDEELSKLFT